MLRANLIKKKKKKDVVILLSFIFVCDATVFFNEILGAILLNRRKWVWNGVAKFKLLVLISPDWVNYT